jgi:hypothetical protein
LSSLSSDEWDEELDLGDRLDELLYLLRRGFVVLLVLDGFSNDWCCKFMTAEESVSRCSSNRSMYLLIVLLLGINSGCIVEGLFEGIVGTGFKVPSKVSKRVVISWLCFSRLLSISWSLSSS